jgi:hypothetical protein
MINILNVIVKLYNILLLINHLLINYKNLFDNNDDMNNLCQERQNKSINELIGGMSDISVSLYNYCN